MGRQEDCLRESSESTPLRSNRQIRTHSGRFFEKSILIRVFPEFVWKVGQFQLQPISRATSKAAFLTMAAGSKMASTSLVGFLPVKA
jgi:hypothetical protein